MTFTQSIMNDVVDYFDHIASLKKLPEIIDSAIAGNRQIVAKDLYEFFLKDKKLQHDLENEEFEKIAKEYNKELIKAAKILRNTSFKDFDVEEYSPWNEGLTSIVHYVDIQNKAPLKYRLYLNIKTEHLAKFLDQFMKTLFTGEVICPECQDVGKYNKEKQQIICQKCQNTNFFFVIKIHQPVKDKDEGAAEGEQDRLMSESVILRRDKIIMGFSEKKVLVAVLKLIKKIGTDVFSDKTPYLTHQIFPGAGVSLEPTKTETEDYRRASQETEELITFEHYLSSIIADNLVKKVQSEKETIEDAYAVWKMDKGSVNKLYKKIKDSVLIPLEQHLAEDDRLKRLFQEMEKIKSEMTSLED